MISREEWRNKTNMAAKKLLYPSHDDPKRGGFCLCRTEKESFPSCSWHGGNFSAGYWEQGPVVFSFEPAQGTSSSPDIRAKKMHQRNNTVLWQCGLRHINTCCFPNDSKILSMNGKMPRGHYRPCVVLSVVEEETRVIQTRSKQTKKWLVFWQRVVWVQCQIII